MWSLVFFFSLTISWAAAQNGRVSQPQEHNGHGWDIRLAVPGEPGNDYPTLGAIPRTSFSCAGREPGYYADLETNCQVFRVCTVGSTYGFQSFLCPNGTLFNQAVFVCDWWMNVDCKNSDQFMDKNNEKFENLRLGPQLMKDIKKMLTHPMLNPYDKNAMKSNLIVMQDYKPPAGQLFPNGALIAGPERPPNNVYVPPKQVQQNLIQGNEYSFSASTPDPRYIPAPLNTNFLPNQVDADIFLRQRQNSQYTQSNSKIQATQNLQSQNSVSNSHVGRFLQNTGYNNGYQQAPRPTKASNIIQRQNGYESQTSQQSNVQNNQRGQYTESRRGPQQNNEQDFGVSFTQTQNPNSNNNFDKQPYNYNTPTSNLPRISNNVDRTVGRDLKQNLVSTSKDVPSTVITKTVSYSKVIHVPKVSKPKSRITVKTWILKPTKSARLIADPTPFTYSRPSSTPSSAPPTERVVVDNTPYVYESPSPSPYAEIISSDPESSEAYIYTKPTEAARQIRTTAVETTRYNPPTTIPTRPTFAGRLNLVQSTTFPTKSSRLYLTPSPFTSTARYYLPPPRNPTPTSRIYLPPDDILQQPGYYQSAKLQASPTIPSSTIVSFTENTNQPALSVTKQTRINNNLKNLTFADILTKEKLDITVNDIVKDTDNILKTASPPQYDQYNTDFKITELSRNDYVSTKTTDSGENLTSQTPTQSTSMPLKSARLISAPARSLEPPTESYNFQNTNQISNLPFYKESAYPNTIERTVSIKITIPERIAMYLFKNRSDSDYDKLEILNTGSSNYLVLSNNMQNTKSNDYNFIPLAKLIDNKNTNISDSQALVYSFLTDSLNVAREYNNIAKQEILSSPVTPTPAQFQNLNNEQLSQITNKISQLTSSQYSSNNNNYNSGSSNSNFGAAQSPNGNNLSQFSAKYTNDQNQPQQKIQSSQYNIQPSQQTQDQLYSSRFQIPNNIQPNSFNNLNNVYSGQLYQLPVPEVTNHIYNSQSSGNLIAPNNNQQQQAQTQPLNQNFQQNNAMTKYNQPNSQFEIIKAETIPFTPAKLQQAPQNDTNQLSSPEVVHNFLSDENTISAQLQDKIVGVIPHPLEQNKLLTYKKDQSYYLFTKLDENNVEQNTQPKEQVTSNIEAQRNAKLVQPTETPDGSSFQLIPSVSFELEDEKEQQQILNAFQIDEFGAPRDVTKSNDVENNSQRRIMTSDVDFTVEHPTSAPKQSEQYNINTLYSGPSSYTAPQSSVGSLGNKQVPQNNFNARLEDFDTGNENGYPRERPARQFIF